MRSARDLDTAAKRPSLQNTLHLSPGLLLDAMNAHAAEAERAAAGLWRRDASVWSADRDVQQKILNRLGWLDSPIVMADAIDRLSSFASAVRRDGFTDVVLLGMGGSSLAPEVLRAVVGVAPGWPQLHMLDSTDPAAVRAVETAPTRTLYLLASKSGTTIEPNVLAAHFRDGLEQAGIDDWARHFVAITDEGTPLARRARDERFRDLFINPSDIGGRYSALSFFGLVPAALMGQDVAELLAWGTAMLSLSDSGAGGPAALGLAIGSAARAGRDKLTLILPDALEPFGLWVEQLIAESTGKHGTGVVPIVGEPIAPLDVYGPDRLFVRLDVSGARASGDTAADSATDALVRDLKARQLPLVEIAMPEPLALGAEFVRWEIATAVAGALLHINPFDEPNVQQAKDATRALLDRYKTEGRLPFPPADRTTRSGVAIALSAAARAGLGSRGPEALLALLGAGDYFALLAYVGPDRALAAELRAFRRAVRDATRAATMFGYGPRYLHSTGQLHKGGPNTGVFVVISATPSAELPIPGEAFSFATLEQAQALGDFSSLDATGRRALHAHLPSPDPRLVRELAEMLIDRGVRRSA